LIYLFIFFIPDLDICKIHNCGFSILCLPFVLLRQKGGVFFCFRPMMYFKPDK